MRVSVRVRRPRYYLFSEQLFTMTNAFLTFFLAKLCITLSKFCFRNCLSQRALPTRTIHINSGFLQFLTSPFLPARFHLVTPA